MIKYRKYLYPLIWLLLLVYASLTPPNKIPSVKLFEHADKVVHFIFYFVFTILLIPVFVKNKKYAKSFVISVLTASVTGLIFEILQHLATTNRTGTVADAIANTLGALSGILFYYWFIKEKKIEKVFF